LLPATIMARPQHGTLLYCAARGVLTPSDLHGKRVGVRSYSQTTVTWIRGILQNDYGVDLNRLHWVTLEDGHVAEYREPPGVERAAAGKTLPQMLRDGEIDAAIAELNDSDFKSVIPDPAAAAQAWNTKHKGTPINHMVVATEKLSKSNPAAVKEVYRLLVQSKRAAGLPKAGNIDYLPYGLEICRPALSAIINFCVQQKLIPRALDVEDLFDSTTRSLAP
jgi:4,5-dihydroxyphthalate decarboxylase